MSGIWILISAVSSFVITAVLGKFMIPYLRKVNFGQMIREEGPKWHKKKEGTPTMGGIIFIIGFIFSSVICVLCYYNSVSESSFVSGETLLVKVRIFGGIAMSCAFGLIGFLDDYIKVVKKRNLGLKAFEKLIMQLLVSSAFMLMLHLAGENTNIWIPFLGEIDFGFFYYIISVLFITGMVNAVNFTDGIDGLNASVTFFVSILTMITAGLTGFIGVGIVSSALAGGCLGFLVWNFNPAKVFMGDTGSLFLGGAVCALVYAIDKPILLIIFGIIYIAEIMSVVLQVSYFKLTKGKRLFKMSPIHHHFEMCGWSEMKICAVFGLVTAVLGALGVFLAIKG